MNYDGRRFRPVETTPNGEVNGATLFVYRQRGDLLEGSYEGGGIRCGQMLGLVFDGGELEFCYQHLTVDGKMRTGKCRSVPEILEDGRLRLRESWNWTSGDCSGGSSIVEEVG
jgi:hypothetical protein